MSIYPIKVTRESARAESSSGGKDYHLLLIETADNRGLVICRFGKKGTWGSLQVTRYDRVEDALRFHASKRREKMGGKYDEPLGHSYKPVADVAELRKVLGQQYWNTIGKGNLEWLLPGADTKSVRDDPQVDKYGNPVLSRDEERRLVPQAPPKIETPEDRVAETPVWGMF